MLRSFSLLFLFIFSQMVHADNVSVSSIVDRNKMGVGDTFTLSITVSSESSVSAQEPQLPILENLDLINSWTGVESRSTFVNGKFQVERKQTFNYMLSPQKVGKVKIDPVKIEVNGKAYVTKPIEIEVVAGSAVPPPRAQTPNPFDDEDDIFSQFLQRRPRLALPTQPIDPEDSFFIQVEVDKMEVYAGEQVTATFYLYSRANITDIDTLKYPSLTGFWKEDIEVATRLGFKDEIINGIVYRKALLASYALFPIKPGAIKVDPYRARCTVVPNGVLGFGRPVQMTKESQELEIQVKALPAPPAGTPFVGGVGEFTVTSNLDSRDLPVNQPLTWKIRFAGTGNAKLIDLPPLDLPEGLELYDTKNEAKFEVNGTSFKEYEVLIIPRKSGVYILPALNMQMFDPQKSTYYQVSTSAENINVQAAQGDETIAALPLKEQEPSQELKSNEPQLILEWPSRMYPLSARQTITLWGGIYFLALLFLLWRGYSELGMRHRKKDIESILKYKFIKIYDLKEQQDWRAVGVEVMNTFYYLLGEISGQGGANQEIEKLMLKVPPSVRRGVGDELLKNLKKFEVLSFAPEAAVGSLKDKSELKKNLMEMEKVLFKAVSLGLGKSRQ